MSTFLPAISTLFIAVSAVLVGFGWYFIVKGQQEKHRRFMLTGAVFAVLFFLIYASRTVFVGNTAFSENAPAWIRDFYYVFLLFHIVLAAVSAVFGIVTLYLAFKQRFVKHKRIGRWTAVLWLCTAPTGVAVYVLLYLLYPGGSIKPVIDAIFGW